LESIFSRILTLDGTSSTRRTVWAMAFLSHFQHAGPAPLRPRYDPDCGSTITQFPSVTLRPPGRAASPRRRPAYWRSNATRRGGVRATDGTTPARYKYSGPGRGRRRDSSPPESLPPDPRLGPAG